MCVHDVDYNGPLVKMELIRTSYDMYKMCRSSKNVKLFENQMNDIK